MKREDEKLFFFLDPDFDHINQLKSKLTSLEVETKEC